MQNMDQEESKMAAENGESKIGTENGESKVGTENEESKVGTMNEESTMGTMNEESTMDTENDEIMGTENDEIMGTENKESKMDTEKDESKMGTENPIEVSSNPNAQSSENVDSKKDTDPAEGSSKQELSEKNTPRSVKAKKIVKKSLAAKLKVKKKNSSPQNLRKKIIRKNKKVGDNAESSHNTAAEKQISDNTPQNENKDEPPKGKSMDAENNEVNKEIDLQEKVEQEQKSEEKSKKRNRRRKNKGKQKGKENSPSKDIKSERLDKKSERLGGLIFMCNAKTKPDCFRYRVMGVSATKKEDVLRIKPGLKLFLYDFDLKLLYGIFKASSSGGMKLETKAFGGKFAAQVRFNVVSDCFPLPENVFKKAIKDNYYEKNKFKTELTFGQVRKLTRLFRPVGVHSAEQPIYSPPKAIVREREVPARVRGRYPHSRRERTTGRLSDRREEVPRDSYHTEKNYQAYGHQGDRRNVATSSRANLVSEPYERDYEHRVLDPHYQSAIPAHVESLRMDPLYLDGREHHNYTRVVSDHREDPYAYPYGASPRDAYLTPLGRENIPSRSYLVRGRPYVETDSMRRREILPDRHYSIYSATDALPEYDRMQPYHGGRLQVSPARVASRYSFAGPPYSLR